MKEWFILMLQDSASPMMEWMMMFHDFTLLINLIIVVLILWIIMNVSLNKFIVLMVESQEVEIIWTIIPIFTLVILGVPSMKILYMLDEVYLPFLTVKVVGHQWYWSYEYSDFMSKSMDSYMVKDINLSSFRLLDSTENLVLPMDVQIRFLISSEDVIHSFAVPSVGIKVDAVPGRLNQGGVNMSIPGFHLGQCSEICGMAHSFMPIVVEGSGVKDFMNYMEEFMEEFIE
uniref:Cytochrome c oxidase subunit 2 n=1 Tax=Leptopilina syphax TaxID=2755057 RepID=A0A7D6KDB6_9HYME|nr:cytochrome c oxidase subunit II [Leptopilina syphax]